MSLMIVVHINHNLYVLKSIHLVFQLILIFKKHNFLNSFKLLIMIIHILFDKNLIHLAINNYYLCLAYINLLYS